MRAEPLGDLPHAERTELDALRTRAYGPDADIFDDPDALARLEQLEEQARRARFGRDAQHLAPGHDSVADAAPGSPRDPIAEPTTRPDEGTPAARTAPVHRRADRHTALVAGAAVLALVVGAAAWIRVPAEARAAGYARMVAAALGQYARDAGPKQHLHYLRDQLLSGPGMEQIAQRVIRGELELHGSFFGRAVGVGPTVDGEICMIVADSPEPAVACVPFQEAATATVSIVLARAGVAFDPERPDLVRYTLLPGGGVLAAPVHPAEVAPPG